MGTSLVVLLLAFAPGIPAGAWALSPENPVTIRVVDKTVPHPNYREHATLFWVLNNQKTQPPAKIRPWTLDRDYIGYYPSDSEDGNCYGEYKKLAASHLTDIDLLFIADAYGVYTLDMQGCGQRMAALDYSKVVVGGFDKEEVDYIENFAKQGGMIIGEFNTFGSPTGGKNRERLSELMGVKWTEWAGRFFPNLAAEDEIPLWAKRNYRKHYQKEWNFKGPGFMFAHEDTRIFVLESPKDVDVQGLRMHHVEWGDPLLDGVLNLMPFLYWFDVNEILPGSELISEYRMAVTNRGRQIMGSFGLTPNFPAIVRASKSPLRLYFAGDFSDAKLPQAPYFWAEWIAAGKEGLQKSDDAYHRNFLWNYYVPLVSNALDVAADAVKAHKGL
jgi:hypothetical protein